MKNYLVALVFNKFFEPVNNKKLSFLTKIADVAGVQPSFFQS